MSIQKARTDIWEYQQAIVRIFGPIRELVPFNQSPSHGEMFIRNLMQTIGATMCCSFMMTSLNPGFLSICIPTRQDSGVTDFPEAL